MIHPVNIKSYYKGLELECESGKNVGVGAALGSLSNDDGNGNENVTWKYNFASLLLLRDYSNLFNLYNVGDVSGN